MTPELRGMKKTLTTLKEKETSGGRLAQEYQYPPRTPESVSGKAIWRKV